MPTVKPGKVKAGSSGTIGKKQAAKLSNNKKENKIASDVEAAYDKSGPKNPNRLSQSKGQKKKKTSKKRKKAKK